MAREQIVQAATRAFARDGILASRLEDIRRDAGVSVGAVYHHFPDKEALHSAAWLRALAAYQDGFVRTLRDSSDAEDGVRGVVGYQLEWVKVHREAAALLYRGRPTGDAAAPLREQNRQFLGEVLAWWRLHAGYGALREVEQDVLHPLWLGATDAYCRQWVAGDLAQRLSETAAGELADAAWQTLRGAGST